MIVCENIGPAERRRRLRIGIASFAIATTAAGLLLYLGAARGWRLLALLPVWVGALSLVEAKTGICVLLAARGLRNMDGGNERVTDADARQALNRRSRSVHLWALTLALFLTAALLALP